MTQSGDRADLSIFFVADGARLEQQSWLLAASLAQAHASGPRPDLIAYASADWLPRMARATRDLFEACGVGLRALPPSPDWARPYPHGNKLAAAIDRRDTGRAVFLDTDMVCTAPLTALADLPADTVAAAPEGVPTWGRDDDRWDRVYAHFDLPYPTERIRLLRGRKRPFVPYYNAGLVAFPDGAPFAGQWIETALEIDHHCRVGGKRPWLDQISLPLTLARFGYRARVLDETWNYALSRRKSMAAAADARILHYHRFRYLRQAPRWHDLLEDFWALLPARHHGTAATALTEMGLIGDD